MEKGANPRPKAGRRARHTNPFSAKTLPKQQHRLVCIKSIY